VVQYLGARVDDALAGFVDALEVGREDFDLAAGSLLADLGDDVDEGLCGAEIVVVTVHAGDDGVLDAELCDGVGNTRGLFVVDRFRLAFGHGAEAAAACAEVAEHHEGGSLMIPALADVGAVGGFTDRVQVKFACQFFEVVEGLAHGCAGF